MRDVVLDTNMLVAGVPTPRDIDDFVEYLPVKIGLELFPLGADLCRTRRRSYSEGSGANEVHHRHVQHEGFYGCRALWHQGDPKDMLAVLGCMA